VVTFDLGGSRSKRCCGSTIAVVTDGRTLRCTHCGKARGILSKPTTEWINQVVTIFGPPTTPIKLTRP
jgi:hypothetical protein